MPEAVIVATGRTPIGRANKGSLVDCRPDDLAALVIREVLAKVPQLDPQTVEDVIMGSGQPGGEAGYNIGRVAALLAGLPDVPGVTVNRYCSSSLQTIRMAAHAIRAGEGDVFIAAGVETVSRYRNGAADTGPHNALFADAEARTVERTPVGGEPWTPATGLPDVYVAMGQTAENVAEYKKVSREEQDEFAVQSQTRAVAAQESGFFDREIIPVTTPNGDVVTKDDGPRGRHGHRRQRLSPQRRCRRGDRDEWHQGPRVGHHPARPHRGQRSLRTQSRDHGLGAGRCHPPDPGARGQDHRRHRPGGDQ